MEIMKIKVLVVEDERPYLRLMDAFLAEASAHGRDFEVSSAEKLAQALELLKNSRFDIILCDLFLPDSAGLETFTAVHNRAPDTPVVLLTGLENDAVAEEAMRRGAQDYLLKKSINPESLARAIMYAIERNAIEVSLRASEERYRTLIDALDDAIVVFDADLRIIMANPAFKKAVKPDDPQAEVTGRRLPEVVSALPGSCIKSCLRALSEGKIIVSEDPCIWNNRESVLEVKCVPVRAAGIPQRVVVVARDITERKQVEQLRDDFASLVSHELRSPLTSITAGIGMVLEDGGRRLEEEEKQLLNISYKDAQRLNRIISKLLEMSRMKSGPSRFKKTLADVAGLADEVIAGFAPRAEKRGIELRKRYSAAKIETMVDTDGITEVFTNLLSNALKFTEKGSVEIGLAEKCGQIECYVKDTGTGIPKENQANLFQKFMRFGKPVAEDEKGTGLGLFIVKEILRRHNGTLAVSSEPGVGTTFTFTLPKCLTEEAAETGEKQGTNRE